MTNPKSSYIPWEDLAVLPELTPPSVMPQGNVGTPLSTFMTLIRTCKLPAHVIKKLQLEFPRSRSSKRYGAVKFDYKTGDYATGVGGASVGEEGMTGADTGRSNREGESDEEEFNEEEEIPSVWRMTI